jgi:hypothetical protein
MSTSDVAHAHYLIILPKAQNTHIRKLIGVFKKMTNLKGLLKFTSKPQLKAIRKAVETNQNYGRSIVKVFSKDIETQNKVCVCVLLKNHTNYLEVCPQLWSLSQEEVTQELVKFYKAVVQLDPSLEEACCFGLKRHMLNYHKYHQKHYEVAVA